jgi:hypothetical protein
LNGEHEEEQVASMKSALPPLVRRPLQWVVGTVLVLVAVAMAASNAGAQDAATFGGVEFPPGAISFADRVVS